MKKQSTLLIILLYYSLLLVGATLAFFSISAAPYIFALGTSLVLLETILQSRNTSNMSIRQKRLVRLRLVNILMLGFAVYYMFIANNSWVVFLLIYALTTIFLSYRNLEK